MWFQNKVKLLPSSKSIKEGLCKGKSLMSLTHLDPSLLGKVLVKWILMEIPVMWPGWIYIWRKHVWGHMKSYKDVWRDEYMWEIFDPKSKVIFHGKVSEEGWAIYSSGSLTSHPDHQLIHLSLSVSKQGTLRVIFPWKNMRKIMFVVC